MNRTEDAYLSLLEAVRLQAQCEYLSDLRYIGDEQRRHLAQSLEKVAPERASLFDWNDALDHLAQAPPEATPQAAKARLIAELSQPQNGAGIIPRSAAPSRPAG